MSDHANKSQENTSKRAEPFVSQTQGMAEHAIHYSDNRTLNVSQLKLQDSANNSLNAIQLRSFQHMANQRSGENMLTQLQTRANKNHLPTKVTQLVGNEGLSTDQLDDAKVDPRRLNNEEESARAKANFGKMRNAVVGNKASIDDNLTKAGVPEAIHDEAASETLRKRLTGSDREDRFQFIDEGVDEKGNRKMGYAKGKDDKEKESQHQLSDDERAGLAAYKGTEGLSEAYQEHARKHLEKFDQAHSFVSESAMTNILSVWKSWGSGSNFVSPKSEADKYLEEAVTTGGGIATLEERLGVPAGYWSNEKKISSIYRFIVNDPQKFKLRLPSGKEGQAYQKEWLSGGKTLGGGTEAVINSMKLEDLKQSVASGAIEILKVVFSKDGEALRYNSFAVNL